jgi:hypothetical protein
MGRYSVEGAHARRESDSRAMQPFAHALCRRLQAR